MFVIQARRREWFDFGLSKKKTGTKNIAFTYSDQATAENVIEWLEKSRPDFEYRLSSRDDIEVRELDLPKNDDPVSGSAPDQPLTEEFFTNRVRSMSDAYLAEVIEDTTSPIWRSFAKREVERRRCGPEVEERPAGRL